MITRIWADLIDLWLKLGPVRRRTALAWAALPGDLVALSVMRLCGGLQPTREIPREGALPVLLVEDPRASRYLDNVPLRPYAQTLGRYILARERLPDATVRHELEHVRQWSRLGPLFLPLYGAASFLAILAGRNRYLDNTFEVAARAREAEPWLPNAREAKSR